MAPQKTEQIILRQALDVFQEIIGLNAEIITDNFYNDPVQDAYIRFMYKEREWRYIAEVKNNLTYAAIGMAAQRFGMFAMKGILITRYINPAMADKLKKMDIPFIDLAGNAYFNEPPVYIFIKGNRPPTLPQPETPTRAFQPTGLQVVFALLCNPGLEDAPYRKIAKLALAALGTIKWVMSDLKQLGFVIDMGKRGRRLVNKEELLERWVINYPEKLKPKLIIGNYKANLRDWWNHANIHEHNAFWGGEVAAAKLTRYLKPEIITIYMKQPITKLLLNYKIKTDPEGDIEILEPFWNIGFDWEHPDLVHPILIYADLLATGDTRNIETAKNIYEKEFARFIRED